MMRSNNKTGYPGVSRVQSRPARPYLASIKINGKNKNLGYFLTAKEASKAYNEALAVKSTEVAHGSGR